MYQKEDLIISELKVVIEKIEYNQLVVRRLDTNKRDYIKKKEWQWDQSVDSKELIFKVKDQLNVVEVEGFSGNYLSLKQKTNPWIEVNKSKFKRGEKVLGEIIHVFIPNLETEKPSNLHEYYQGEYALIQLYPGINAKLYPLEMPMDIDQKLSDVIFKGDKIMVSIIYSNFEEKEIEVSLNDWINHLDDFLKKDSNIFSNFQKTFKEKYGRFWYQAPEEYLLEAINFAPTLKDHFLIKIFEDTITNCISSDDNKSNIKKEETIKKYEHLPIPFPERILLIDNNKEENQKLVNFLAANIPQLYKDLNELNKNQELKTFKHLDIDGEFSGFSAIEKCKENDFDLIIIDIKLHLEHGFDVAKKVLEINNSQNILFISSDPFAPSELKSIFGRRFPFAHRNSANYSEIMSTIKKMVYGFTEEYLESDDHVFSGTHHYIQKFEAEALKIGDPQEILDNILSHLQSYIKVKYIFLIKADLNNEQTEIISSIFPIDSEILNKKYSQLFYSPIRDIILEERSLYIININQKEDRYKNFFPDLVYSELYGLPIKIPGFITQYALIILDNKGKVFDSFPIDEIKMASNFIQIALERKNLHDYIRRIEKRYFLGEILSSFGHEFSNMLTGLENWSLAFIKSLDKIKKNQSSTEDSLEQLSTISHHIDISTKKFKSLLDAYGQLVKGKFEEIHFNDIIKKIIRLLGKSAQSCNVGIVPFILEPDAIPSIKAIASRLEQVVDNIVLNAIQQIESKSKFFNDLSFKTGNKISFMQSGFVLLIPRYCPQSKAVQLLIIDSGPGIHYSEQETIFNLGVSNRDRGQGLGLYISRNLAEAMKGRIRLLKSILYTGSVFLIEFPVLEHTN
jgi:signal transduction histidine kinase/CheY-like chemotaxis protein